MPAKCMAGMAEHKAFNTIKTPHPIKGAGGYQNNSIFFLLLFSRSRFRLIF